jgi:hypothetical protein
MSHFTPTERITLHRRPHRASYDRAVVEAIFDEALSCHVGFVLGGQGEKTITKPFESGASRGVSPSSLGCRSIH